MTDHLDLEAVKERDAKLRAALPGAHAMSQVEQDRMYLIAEVERLRLREAAAKRAVNDFYEDHLSMPEAMLLLRALYRRPLSENNQED